MAEAVHPGPHFSPPPSCGRRFARRGEPYSLTPARRSVSHAFAAALVAIALTFAGATAAAQSLEARLQRLEDREEIRALILEYGRALDARDFEAFAELFAEQDGEWIGGLGAVKGRAGIRELMEATFGTGPATSPNFHVFTNEKIEVDGDSASAATKWIFVVQGEGERPEWVFLGHYDDVFVRENGRWKFLRREAFTDIPSQAASASD
jgi:uncharacterized protein (TIGR02246 family)